MQGAPRSSDMKPRRCALLFPVAPPLLRRETVLIEPSWKTKVTLLMCPSTQDSIQSPTATPDTTMPVTSSGTSKPLAARLVRPTKTLNSIGSLTFPLTGVRPIKAVIAVASIKVAFSGIVKYGLRFGPDADSSAGAGVKAMLSSAPVTVWTGAACGGPPALVWLALMIFCWPSAPMTVFEPSGSHHTIPAAPEGPAPGTAALPIAAAVPTAPAG